MSDEIPTRNRSGKTTLAVQVGAKADRLIKGRRNSPPEVWFGLGMMGLVGWSVVVPTLIGAAAGIWLDAHHPGPHSWTLALLVAGLLVGCVNAWYWVAQEDAKMHDDEDDDNE
jgi:ATP synthase protein I